MIPRHEWPLLSVVVPIVLYIQYDMSNTIIRFRKVTDMRFEKGHKETTRKHIVEVASERFRKDGIAAVGIATAMADAGLTHGGFYAHFESKEDLVREAMEAAFTQSKARHDAVRKPGPAGLEAYIRSYLRSSHRDTPERGCAAATLVAEIARSGEATRGAFASRLEIIFDRIEEHLPAEIPGADRRSIAIGIFSILMGTIQMSRIFVDQAESETVLESGIKSALKLAAIEPL